MPEKEHKQKHFLPPTVRLLRPEQWTKNALVMAAFFFAYWDPSQNLKGKGLKPFLFSVAATALFCMVSSGIYAFNDWRDRVSDRLHPVKKFRPVASGEVSAQRAQTLAATLIFAGLIASSFLPHLCIVLSAYVLLQLIYSSGLKHIPLLDVFIIATGFVLRAIAGAAVLSVRISPWLLLCSFLLALFLALCKRRQEKVVHDESVQRRSTRGYSVELLNALIAITAAATVVSYSLYTLSSETTRRFGTPLLGLTIPIVLFGIFRYIHLVYTSKEGERPEYVLLTDRVIIATVFVYFAVTGAIFVFG